MKLYHYSKALYNELRTIEKQRIITEKEYNKALETMINYNYPGMYFEHISFFIDPVPLDIIASIYFPKHQTWFSGNKLFEYVIETDSISEFKYEIVESSEKTALYYDESLTLEQYHQLLTKAIKDKQYIGYNNKTLLSAITPLLGTTRVAFIQAPYYNNWQDIKNKYAANIPHVMLYPKQGIIFYEDVISVIVK